MSVISVPGHSPLVQANWVVKELLSVAERLASSRAEMLGQIERSRAYQSIQFAFVPAAIAKEFCSLLIESARELAVRARDSPEPRLQKAAARYMAVAVMLEQHLLSLH
jgi:hypothetical protein